MEGESGRLVVASTMSFTIYLGQFMRTPIVPLFAEELGATIVEVGLVTTAFMVVAAALAIPLGITSDRLGRRRLVIAGSLLSTAAPFLLTLTKSPATVILVSAFGGFGSAAYSPAMTAFVGDVSKSDRRGKSYGYYTTAMQTAMALGPGLGGLVADLVGYHYTFIISGLLIMVGTAVGILFFPGGENRSATHPDATPHGLLSMLRERNLLRCWIATFCISFMWGAASAFLAIYARGVGLIATEIGLLFT